MATAIERFPVGGSRQEVYDFLVRHGFQMSNFSDKQWTRGDLTAHVYGAGSKVQVSRGKELIADGPLGETIEALNRK